MCQPRNSGQARAMRESNQHAGPGQASGCRCSWSRAGPNSGCGGLLQHPQPARQSGAASRLDRHRLLAAGDIRGTATATHQVVRPGFVSTAGQREVPELMGHQAPGACRQHLAGEPRGASLSQRGIRGVGVSDIVGGGCADEYQPRARHLHDQRGLVGVVQRARARRQPCQPAGLEREPAGVLKQATGIGECRVHLGWRPPGAGNDADRKPVDDRQRGRPHRSNRWRRPHGLPVYHAATDSGHHQGRHRQKTQPSVQHGSPSATSNGPR